MSDPANIQAEGLVDNQALIEQDNVNSNHRGLLRGAVRYVASNNVLLSLIAFQIVNALGTKTFFQPDEYFQSLEPAWQLAFGEDSGAWITWEWRNRLRSAIHPMIFAAVYSIASALSQLLQLSPVYRADVLIAAPKVLQAVFAALGDYFTWRLAGKVYGAASNEAWAALALTVISPWQAFCGTRTFSNALEMTLTVNALYLWFLAWSKDLLKNESDETVRSKTRRHHSVEHVVVPDLAQLRGSLLLAALACILRPTNLLIWLCVGFFCLLNGTQKERTALVREAVLCGSSVLVISILLDRFYYHTWTFPPLRFLYFNIAQDLAIIYGSNDWHYYLTQGYPLLLTTFLPFALVGLYRALTEPPQSSTLSNSDDPTSNGIARQLATTALVVPTALSLVSHKEVRFIYSILPILHVLAAQPFTAFFLPIVSPAPAAHKTMVSRLKKALFALLIIINAFICFYTMSVHQSGVISVMDYLRHEHEYHYLSQPPSASHIAPADPKMTVGFLMPCHSTPWRSHLVHPGITAWALDCEPPVNMNATERAEYVDEADRFYANPSTFMNQEMGQPPRVRSSLGFKLAPQGLGYGNGNKVGDDANGRRGKKEWPEYLVFFQQAEEMLRTALKGSGYRQCWRRFNSHWHDDWRRSGDVIVWCLQKRSWSRIV